MDFPDPNADRPRTDARPVTDQYGRTIVWLDGEHDMQTVHGDARLLTEALAADGDAIVVDLSGVTFLDASTIGVLLAARDNSRRLSQGFALRAPSSCAARLLRLCGLEDLLETAVSGDAPALGDGALRSWVAVPAAGRGDAAAPSVRQDTGDDALQLNDVGASRRA